MAKEKIFGPALPAVLFIFSILIICLVCAGSFYVFHMLPNPAASDKPSTIAADASKEKPKMPDGNDPAMDTRGVDKPSPAQARIGEAVVVIRLGQVMVGMLIGLFLICLGSYFSWIGVREKIGMEFHGVEGVKATVAALGPGMVLAVCGTILISVCILKQVSYSDQGGVIGSEAGK